MIVGTSVRGVNANIGKWIKASLQFSGDMGEQNNSRNGITSGGTDADFNSLMTHLPFVPGYVGGRPVIYTGMENVSSGLSAVRLFHLEQFRILLTILKIRQIICP